MKRSILTCGDFGRSMAAVLRGWSSVDLEGPANVADLRRRLAATVSSSSLVVFASWRERQDVARLLDRLCHEAGRPWIAVVAEHPWVRVGPGIAPGRTPCYQCFGLRRLQHDGNAQLSVALQGDYAKDFQKGVRGYLPHHVTIAAGLTSWIEGRLTPSDDRRSPVLLYNTLRNEIALDHVVGVHGCNLCDAKSAGRTNDPILACLAPLARGSSVARPATAEGRRE
jgi:bacteriocin biosynthesis cyclodehydratase domain-containing protein